MYVYIVTYPGDDDKPIVTAFSRKEPACDFYSYVISNKSITHPHRVSIDQVPVYNNFIMCTPQ